MSLVRVPPEEKEKIMVEPIPFDPFEKFGRDKRRKPSQRGKWVEVARLLKSQPGQWFKSDAMLVDTSEKAQMLAYRIRTGKLAPFRPEGTFDATWAKSDEGDGYQVF